MLGLGLEPPEAACSVALGSASIPGAAALVVAGPSSIFSESTRLAREGTRLG